MADPGALRLSAMLDASPFIGGISQMVGGLSKMSNALKLGTLAVGFFTYKALRGAVDELFRFEKAAIEVTKVLGSDIAGPIISSIRELSLTMPVARDELLDIASTAARLGITGKDNILKFTEVVAKIGIATDVSSGVAAESLARLAKQTGMPIDKIEGLGAAINQLDNTMAVSSAGIIDASARSAAELSRLGFTVPEILALNAALAEVSESSSRAGTRLNRLAQELGNPKRIETFAKALNMAPEAFKAMRRESPMEALRQLIDVMQDGGDVADELASNLDSRVRRALQQLSQNEKGLVRALAESNSEFAVAISLNREYAEFMKLASARTEVLKNNVIELKTKLGEELAPALISVTNAAIAAFQWLNKVFSEPLKAQINKDGLDEFKNELYDLRNQVRAGSSDMEQSFHGLWIKMSDGFFDVLNILLPKFAEFYTTWEQFNKQAQQDLVDLMDTLDMDASATPAFFAVLVDKMKLWNDENKRWTDVYPEVIRLAETFANIDFSNISDNRDAMEMFRKSFEEFNRQLAEGIINEREYDLAIRSAMASSLTFIAIRDENARKIREANELSEEQQKAIDKLIKSLQDEINVLTKTKEAVFKLSEEYQNADERDKATLLTKWRKIQALEAEKVAWEKLQKAQERSDNAKDAARQSYRDEEVRLATEIYIRNQLIDGIQDEARARYEAGLQLSEWNEEERARLMMLYDEMQARQDLLDIREKEAKQSEDEAKKAEARQERIKALIDKYSFATFESQLRLFERAVGDTADSLVDTFEALITGADNAGEAIVDMFRDIARMLLQMQLQRLLFNTFGPLLFPDEFGAAGNFSGTPGGIKPFGAFAAGGRPRMNRVSLVGEKGPELFVPDTAGTVVPNGSFGMGDTNVNVTYQIQALDSASVREMLVREQRTIAALTINTINRHRTMKRT